MAFPRFSTAYVSARSCTGGPRAGTMVLYQWLFVKIGELQNAQAVKSGVYNCRNIGGTSRKSIHSEGRAGDNGIRTAAGMWPTSKIDEPGMDLLMEFLTAQAARLGIQEVIYARRRWTASKGWVRYNGQSPHNDHAHWSQTVRASHELTREMVEAAWREFVGEPEAGLGAGASQVSERKKEDEEVDLESFRLVVWGQIEQLFFYRFDRWMNDNEHQKWSDRMWGYTDAEGISDFYRATLHQFSDGKAGRVVSDR